MSRGLSRLALAVLYPARWLAYIDDVRKGVGSPAAAMHIASGVTRTDAADATEPA